MSDQKQQIDIRSILKYIYEEKESRKTEEVVEVKPKRKRVRKNKK